jgi:hypothetical protein
MADHLVHVLDLLAAAVDAQIEGLKVEWLKDVEGKLVGIQLALPMSLTEPSHQVSPACPEPEPK